MDDDSTRLDMHDLPPAYTPRSRTSVLPGTSPFAWGLIVEYDDDGRPSISVMGFNWVSGALGDIDVWSPGRGVGVGVVQLRDPDARTRFGAFGRELVRRERRRRGRQPCVRID